MSGFGPTEIYLPPEHLGAVEAMLLAKGGSLVAPLFGADEVDASFALSMCAAPIATCIRSMTRQFPDGPTYFAISRSYAVNALIARFSTFQCVVVAQGVHVRASTLIVSLLAWEPLRTFIATGCEPEEPMSEPVRSREEALVHLAGQTPTVTNEVGGVTACLTYLLLYLLTAHEIGHLALGHLDRRTDGKMDEVGETDEPRAESRAQEWDADGFALAGTLYLAGSEFRLQPVWRDLLTDIQASLRVIAVVAYVLFTLMDSMGPQDRTPEERTHPRPLVRVGLATLTLTAVMDQFGAVSGEEVMDTNRSAIRAVEIALHEMAGGVMEEPLARQLGEEFDAEVDRLVAVLGEELWPKLDRRRLQGLFWARALMVRPV